MDDAYPIEDIDEILPDLLERRTRVYYHFGRDTDFDLKLLGWPNPGRAPVRRGAGPTREILEMGHLLAETRLFNSCEALKQSGSTQCRSKSWESVAHPVVGA